MHGGEAKVLPNELSEESKWVPSAASELHDNINIVVLSVLGFSSVWALFSPALFGSWLTWLGFAYISFDTVWLLVQPSIVKSPRMILGHHFATLVVLLDPLLISSHAIYTSACLLVEINTVLLLLRRKMAYSNLVEVPFMVSWIALRCIWYPLLLLYFAACAMPETLIPLAPAGMQELRAWVEGRPDPATMLLWSMLAWAAVCFFQLLWTHQLLASHPWLRATPPTAAPADDKAKKFL